LLIISNKVSGFNILPQNPNNMSYLWRSLMWRHVKDL